MMGSASSSVRISKPRPRPIVQYSHQPEGLCPIRILTDMLRHGVPRLAQLPGKQRGCSFLVMR